MSKIDRRTFTTLAAATLLAPRAHWQSPEMLNRAIPSTGKRLAPVGLGTAQIFDIDDEATKQKADAVLQALIAGGGRLVDTASVYGEAEVVIATSLRAPICARTFSSRPNLKRPTKPSSSGRSPAYGLISSIFCSCTMYAIPSSRLHNSRNGRRRAFAATSVSPRHATPTSQLSKPFWRARSPISFKSIIRLMIAKPRNAS